MTVEDRRNSVLRSSISIKSIQKSVVNFKEGLTKLGSTSNDIVSQTKETNLFKTRISVSPKATPHSSWDFGR